MRRSMFLATLFTAVLAVHISWADAATVNFSFSGTGHIGYVLWERTNEGKVEVAHIDDPAATSYQWETEFTDEFCRTFFITAKYSDGSTEGYYESGPSNAAAICPEYTLPPMIVRQSGEWSFEIIK